MGSHLDSCPYHVPTSVASVFLLSVLTESQMVIEYSGSWKLNDAVRNRAGSGRPNEGWGPLIAARVKIFELHKANSTREFTHLLD